MSKVSSDIKCSHCGIPLSVSHSGPCPKCGKEGRSINESIVEGVGLSDSLSWKTTREFYEKDYWALAAVIIITILSPFIGLFLAGIPGALVGLFLGGIAYYIGPTAITKVREIRTGQ